MKKIAVGIVLILLIVLPGPVRAAPPCVSDWEALRQAVSLATPGDRIMLAGDLEADGEIVIGKAVTISGGGYALRPRAGYCGRAFVLKNAAVTIEETRFEGFCCRDGNAAVGGAVFSQNCTVNLLRCAFTGNSADNSGGALYHAKGTLHITDCVFDRNEACTSDGTGGFGGAVFNDGGELAATDCAFTANAAGRYGGALYLTFNSETQDNKAAFSGCTFERNEANGGGGAVYALSGTQPLSVNACTFVQNRVTGPGGGGGAMEVRAPQTYIIGSAFTGNASEGEGPALKMLAGVLYTDSVAFERNIRGATYEYGEDIALSYGYKIDRLALLAEEEGQPCGRSFDIGERAQLFIGCEAQQAPFIIESSDVLVFTVENDGKAEKTQDGYAAAFTAESTGNARITLREEGGKAYAVLDVSVSTVSARRSVTGISFKEIKKTLPVQVEGQTLRVSVPANTDVTCLTPTIEYEGASISPEDGVPMDFSVPVVFTVTAENQKTRAYKVVVNTEAAGLSITGIPENEIVYAGGKYVLKASVAGGQWSYYAYTVDAEAVGDTLAITPLNAGGGWVEYEVVTGEGRISMRREFTVVPALLPVTGQSMDGIALFIVLAALCSIALKMLPGACDS